MKKFFVILMATCMIFSNISTALALDRLATADDQIWGGTGVPNPANTNVTEAVADDGLDIDGYRVYISNDQTANDGSGLDEFNVGKVTDSNTGGGADALVVRNGSGNDLVVNFTHADGVSVAGAFTVDNNLLVAGNRFNNTTTVTNALTVGGNLTVANYNTTADKNVSLTVGGDLQITGTVYLLGAAGATGADATLIANGADLDWTGLTLDDDAGGLTTLTLGRAGDQDVTGTIDGGAGGNEGTLNVNGTGDTLFHSNIGNTNSLLAVNVAAADTKTAEFDGVVKATTITMSGLGEAQFDGAVTATNLNLNSAGTVTLNANSTITTTTLTDAGTLGLEATLTGNVDNGGNLLTVNTVGANGNVNGVLSGAGGFTKGGAGTLTLSGNNTYTGDTNINAGTVVLGAAVDALPEAPVTVATVATLDLNGGDEDIGALSGGGTVTNSAAATNPIFRVGLDDGSSTFSGLLEDGNGTIIFRKQGTGTLTLTGANTYSGLTTINGGTLRVSNSNAVGTGALTNNATLDLGTTTLTVNGVYTQNALSTMTLAANSGTDHGQINSASAAVVDAGSNIYVTVGGYMADGTKLTVVDAAAGAGVNVPGTITSSNGKYTFLGSVLNGDLFLTVKRGAGGGGFESCARNGNELRVAKTLDVVTDPTGDMINVLTTMDGLSPTATADALDELMPSVNAGVMDISHTTVSLFQEKVTEHLADTRSGVAAGDTFKDVDIWAKGFGNYLDQDKRDHIDGYKAHTLGTTVGVDFLVADPIRVGISGGYAFSRVDSKQSNIGDTDIDSYQGTVYGGYDGGPFYIDVAGSFAYNKYEGSRTITFGNVARTADSDYDGQQYSAYIGGGYTFETNGLEITPMASLRYIYLYLEDYRESGADALNLKVDSQDYDFLQSGLGARFAYPIRTADMTFIPEIHGMWLYDFVGDEQQTTSIFTGGGASFKTDGADPAQHSFNVGGSLTFAMTNNISLLVAYDFEGKEDFIGHSGSVTIKYSF